MNKSKIKNLGVSLAIAVASGLIVNYIINKPKKETLGTIKRKVYDNALSQLSADIDLQSEGVPVPDIDSI